jgi:polysaccharide deacetylase family protein (PEP-CTERM system associated)
VLLPPEPRSRQHRTRQRVSGRSRTPLLQLRRQHILTIELEDFYQTGTMRRLVDRGSWYRFESRLEKGTIRTLDLLDQFGAKATFFTLGWVADAAPELIRMIAERGHELATRGYYHRTFDDFAEQEEFRYDASRAKETLEQVINRPVVGYRIADGRLRPKDLWALKALQQLGFSYDSSIKPMFRDWAHEPIRRFVQRQKMDGPEFWEVPFGSTRFFGVDVPIAGGNYFRQFPEWVMRKAVARWEHLYRAPFVAYFHTWELDPEQPHLEGTTLLMRVRQYRHLHKMPAILAHYLSLYRFTSIAEHLRLDVPAATAPTDVADLAAVSVTGETMVAGHAGAVSAVGPGGRPSGETAVVGREAVTIVVPCYNEEDSLPRLVNTLLDVRTALADKYEIRAILVDDASTDGTWEVMSRLFAWDVGTRCFRQPHNIGTAAAILRGIRDAETPIVASMDADCSYDPHELAAMLPLLAEGVDVVTASPYHPAGQLKNVPLWRRAFTRMGGGLYRVAFRHKLHTYTSLFRVYRRSSVKEIRLRHSGSVGVAELLGRLEQKGAKIVEYPATFEARRPSSSKLKALRAGIGHLILMGKLAARRALGPFRKNEKKEEG